MGILIGSGIYLGLGLVKLKGFASVGFFFSGYFIVYLISTSCKVDSKVFTKSLFLPVAFYERIDNNSAILGSLSSSFPIMSLSI